MIPKITITILVMLAAPSVALNTRTVGTPAQVINACPDGPMVLEVGEFHGDEVEAQTGEQWFPLHISGEQSMLLDYQLTVEAVHDAMQGAV